MRRRAAAAARVGVAVSAILGPACAGAEDSSCPGHVSVAAAQASWYVVAAPECSLPVTPSEFVTAVATPDYLGSQACGRCLRVAGPLGSVVVRVVDECLSCAQGDLDLGSDAFAQIGNPMDGVVPISYESTECPVSGPVDVYMGLDTDASYAAIQLRNHLYPVASLEAYSGGAWLALSRRADDYFALSPAGGVPAPLELRATDVNGSVVSASVPLPTAGTDVAAAGQFSPCPEPSRATGAATGFAALVAARRMRSRSRR